jgi:hypothetical protein
MAARARDAHVVLAVVEEERRDEPPFPARTENPPIWPRAMVNGYRCILISVVGVNHDRSTSPQLLRRPTDVRAIARLLHVQRRTRTPVDALEHVAHVADDLAIGIAETSHYAGRACPE